MSTLQDAIRRILDQFERHQSLRQLMQNTLAAIIETEVGALFKRHQEMEATLHVLRDFLGAELDHDHTRGEAKQIQRKAFEMVRDFAGSNALRKAWTRAEKAEEQALALSMAIRAAHADATGEVDKSSVHDLAQHLGRFAREWVGRGMLAEKRLLTVGEKLITTEAERDAARLMVDDEPKREAIIPDHHCHECGVAVGLPHSEGCNQAKVMP